MKAGGFGLLLALTAAAFAGCSSARPVLYPNGYYKMVGKDKAEQDIDDCMRMAEDHDLKAEKSSGAGKRAAENTVKNTGAGAATGAAVGAFNGTAGIGAAVGAAGNAAGSGSWGLLDWMFNSSEPDQIYRRFVERSLREKGYEPIGWKD